MKTGRISTGYTLPCGLWIVIAWATDEIGEIGVIEGYPVGDELCPHLLLFQFNAGNCAHVPEEGLALVIVGHVDHAPSHTEQFCHASFDDTQNLNEPLTIEEPRASAWNGADYVRL